MKTYRKRKEELRQQAIRWQYQISGADVSYYYLAQCQALIKRKAKRYGLIKEFRENGII